MLKLISLAGLFTLTAFLYASVGFGGGSTYTALLVASGTDYSLVPIIALSCNIIVVFGNSIRYTIEGLIPWKRLWPILFTSIPFAWLGGRLDVSEILFIGLLAVALFLAGLRLIFRNTPGQLTEISPQSIPKSMLIGGGIGLYSGIVGIGGGIFLAPILYTLNWGRAKTIAAACSIFILFNSISGLVGQFMKLSDTSKIFEAGAYWPLLPAVFIGGVIGNHAGLSYLSQDWVKRLTGILILLVSCRLFFSLFQTFI